MYNPEITETFFMKYKACAKCKKPKPITEFGKRTASKDGLRARCKKCRVGDGREYYRDNKEKVKETGKQWRKNNPSYSREYNREWRKKEPEKARITKKRYQEKKKNTNPSYTINNRMRTAIGRSLRGNKKGQHWEGLVGYTYDTLIVHLKKTIPKGYTWEDYLTGKLQLDHHPIPLYWFVFEKSTDKGFKKAWALENLRLFPASDNARKKNKLFY